MEGCCERLGHAQAPAQRRNVGRRRMPGRGPLKRWQLLATAGQGPDRKHACERSAVQLPAKGGRCTLRQSASAERRNTKVDTAGARGNPLAFLLTPGQATIWQWALLHASQPRCIVHVASDNPNRVETSTSGRGSFPTARASRRWRSCCRQNLDKDLSAVGRMFCRLKDRGRVATGHDPSTPSRSTASTSPPAPCESLECQSYR